MKKKKIKLKNDAGLVLHSFITSSSHVFDPVGAARAPSLVTARNVPSLSSIVNARRRSIVRYTATYMIQLAVEAEDKKHTHEIYLHTQNIKLKRREPISFYSLWGMIMGKVRYRALFIVDRFISTPRSVAMSTRKFSGMNGWNWHFVEVEGRNENNKILEENNFT